MEISATDTSVCDGMTDLAAFRTQVRKGYFSNLFVFLILAVKQEKMWLNFYDVLKTLKQT